MERLLHKITKSRARFILALILLLSFIVAGSASHRAFGDFLRNRSLTIADSTAGATTNYKIQFDIYTAGTLGSIQAEFCSNSPIFSIPCTPPAGFDISAASLFAQTGETGFSISPLTTANKLILTRAPIVDATQTVSYELSGVMNPSAQGSYYVRLQTFATSDATGPNTDFGGLAYDINNNLQISTEVPPYLIFCAGNIIPAYNCSGALGSLVDLGLLASNKTASGQSQLLVSTNAENGYSMYVQGTTLTSGNNEVGALTSPSAVLTGANQFGLNLRANLAPAIGQDPAGPGIGLPTSDYNQPNRYKFVNGDVIATSPSFEDFRRFTVSYVADIKNAQISGVYVSTLTYVCIGNF